MQKQEKIVQRFDSIAPTYDITNRILSFGIDKSWRKRAVDFVLEKYSHHSINIADIACGTGDMISLWDKRAKLINIVIKSIAGIDPSKGMLEVARKKFIKNEKVRLECAYADNTGLESDWADIISISYGIRNVSEREKALCEFNRVLKNGGYLLVLEFTKRSKKGFMANLRDFYLLKMLPKIGGFISKNKNAYEYLPQSIENFLDKEQFKSELKKAGFQVEIIRSFSFDICSMFVARKVKELDDFSMLD